MTFIAFTFGVAALVLFIVAFSNVFKGRIGAAVVTGLIALVMASVAGATAIYGD